MDVFVMDRKLVCAVELPKQGDNTARWSVYDLDNNKLSYGFSQGMEKSGVGCIPMAMGYAKRSARRLLQKGKVK